MARVADYAIALDDQVSMKIGGDIDKEFTFNLPDNTHLGSRAILAFIKDLDNPSGLSFVVQINGTQVVSLTDSSNTYHTVHEVIQTRILKKGSNTIRFQVTGGSGTLQVSDVVLWFQVDV